MKPRDKLMTVVFAAHDESLDDFLFFPVLHSLAFNLRYKDYDFPGYTYTPASYPLDVEGKSQIIQYPYSMALERDALHLVSSNYLTILNSVPRLVPTRYALDQQSHYISEFQQSEQKTYKSLCEDVRQALDNIYQLLNETYNHYIRQAIAV